MSSGALLRPSTCLCCQLREVILRTRSSPRTASNLFHQQCRQFSTRRPLCEEATTGLIRRVDHKQAGRSPRSHIRVDASGERYVGKGKKRQKVVVESLPTKFLGTTQADSGVIVMRDAEEEEPVKPKDAAHKYLSFNQPVENEEKLSAEDIESEVKAMNAIPKQEDVDASIEALKVEVAAATTIVDKATFQALKKKLMDRYTAGQLSNYLNRSLIPRTSAGGKQKPSSIRSKIQELGTSQWRQGKTPISQRPSGVLKKTPSNKQQFAENILRLSWWMTIESEEKDVGEIELHLRPWQMSLLFDLVSDNGRPYYESLIDSQPLVANSSIALYRPASIMRVTARRRDAEEIVRRVNLELVNASRLDWNLNAHLLGPGTAGQHVAASTLFRDEDVRYVARLTRSAIMFGEDDKVSIHSRMRDDTINARRLLLSLLPTNSKPTYSVSGAVQEAVILHSHAKNAVVALPVGPVSSGLQRRYHNLDLVRRVKPCAVSGEKTTSNEEIPKALEARLEKAAVTVARELDQLRRANLEYEAPSDSYWRQSSHVLQPDWKVNFRRLLQEAEPAGSKKTEKIETAQSTRTATQPTQFIAQSTVPGIETALSYFSPVDAPRPEKSSSRSPRPPPDNSPNLENKTQAPFIMAYFTPAVSNPHSSTPLPSLAMSFHFKASRRGSGSWNPTDQELILTSLVATTSEQRLSVPLPLFCTDMVFTRKALLKAMVPQAMADKAIQNFVYRVQRSATSKEGVLTAPAELTVRLPAWVVGGGGGGGGTTQKTAGGGGEEEEEKQPAPDVPVNYIFERFEQIQAIHFAPPVTTSAAEPEAMDPDVQSLLRTFPNNLAVDYREVEGGAIFGNSTTLALRFLKDGKRRKARREGVGDEGGERGGDDGGGEGKGKEVGDGGQEGETSSPHLAFVRTALRMARVLTKVGGRGGGGKRLG